MGPTAKLALNLAFAGCAISPLPMWEIPQGTPYQADLRFHFESLISRQFSNLVPQQAVSSTRQRACITKVWRVL
jgi:hypothetical protein